MENNEVQFKLVQRKTRGRRAQKDACIGTTGPHQQTHNNKDSSLLRSANTKEEEHFDVTKFRKRLADCLQEVLLSEFFTTTFSIVRDSLTTAVNAKSVDAGFVDANDSPDTGKKKRCQIVCYGLGNFTSCPIARYQLALLMALRQKLEVSCEDCFLFDPVFSQHEKDYLTQESFEVILENEEGKRECCGPTIAYLPHCGKALYNNLLWRNLATPQCRGLRHLVLLGNSFGSMMDRTPTRVLQKTAGFIVKLQPHCKETPLATTFRHQDVFNDLSVHTFPGTKLTEISGLEDLTEPVYDGDDVEYIPR